MKLKLSALLLSLILPAISVQAQVYKWVGPDGKVQFSDKPPPDNAKGLEKRAVSGSANDLVNFPKDLATATTKNPVTYYVAANCAPCNTGRNFLKKNGIPFAEKTVSSAEDSDKLKQVSGSDTQLPVLVVGSQKVIGLDTDEYRRVLTVAGYPETNKLPKDYQYPAAGPAAPPKPVEKDANAPKPAVKPAEPAKPESNFRF